MPGDIMRNKIKTEKEEYMEKEGRKLCSCSKKKFSRLAYGWI